VQHSTVPITFPESELAVSLDWPGGLVRLSGELDRDSAHHLLDALQALALTGHRVLSVDAADVTFCDAGGLRALVVGSRLLRDGGQELRVVGASRCVGRLLALAGLDLTAAAVPGPIPIDLDARRARTIRIGRRTAIA